VEGDRSKNRIDEWITRAKRHLAVRSRQKPITKAGQLRALWPEIQIALDQGQTLKAIRDWLAEQGLVFRGGNFRTYVLRIRRERSKQAAARFLEAAMPAPGPDPAATPRTLPADPQGAVSPAIEPIVSDRSFDPLAQAREALAKRRFDIRKIHGDGDPSDRNLF
jgi:hypothetical protein